MRFPTNPSRLLLAGLVGLALACSASAPQTAASPAAASAAPASLNAPPVIAGCAVFPADNIWNMPVDTVRVDGRSNSFVNTIGLTATMHADFGEGEWEGG